MSDAYLSKATQMVHGYFTERAGALRFEIAVEDAARHKMVNEAVFRGDVLGAMDSAAKGLDPRARPFSSSNAEAIEAWARGEYDRAVSLDPNFGPAWLAWAQSLASKGDTPGAIDATARALANSALRSQIDRARIEVLSANLHKDPDARRKALTDLAKLEEADTTLLETLAQIETNARRFSASAELYRRILRADPGNVAAMNSLGYAEAFTGNLDAARKAFEEYGRQPDQKPNSLDSLGEASFMNGQFKDAEKYFLQTYDANAAFLGGATLEKAAYARWLGGDLAGADAIMNRYLTLRTNLHDPLVAWREATWLYATGRRERAMAKLQSAPAEVIEKQTAAWNRPAPDDLSALKDLYERTSPNADGYARTFYAAALLQAGRKDEARQLLALWPLPEAGDPSVQSMVFPKFVELRSAVGQ